MVFANWLVDQMAEGAVLMFLGIGILLHYARKYGNSNPNVKSAAKEALASAVIKGIGRIFKK